MNTFAYQLYREIVMTDNIDFAKSIIESHDVKRQVTAAEHNELFDIYFDRLHCEEKDNE